MDRRFFITALSAAPLISFGSTANAQSIVIDSVNDYLNSLHSATAYFTQTSPQGLKATGTFYLQKPGKMRFEYDPPSAALLVSDGNALAVFDKKSNRGPQRYPLGSTPLSLLARNDIDVTRSQYVKKLESNYRKIHLSLYDPADPNIGYVRIEFDRRPMKLTGWAVVEASGAETVVKLNGLSSNISLDSALFSIPQTIRALNQGN